MRLLPVIAIATLLSSCAVVPPPATSKSDAIARVRVVRGEDLSSGSLYELPANSTGTGPHDFYSLFVRIPVGANAVYGISIATGGKLSSVDAQVAATNGIKFKVEGRQRLSAGLGNKIDCVQATFDRDFLNRAASEGTRLQVTSSRGSIEFTIDDWMFAALLQVADEHDYHRRFARERKEEQEAQQQRRELYVQAHPELADRVKSAVLKGNITLGLSCDDTRASWGAPTKIHRTVGTYGVHEQWIYGDTYIYFENGILTSWQDSR